MSAISQFRYILILSDLCVSVLIFKIINISGMTIDEIDDTRAQ